MSRHLQAPLLEHDWRPGGAAWPALFAAIDARDAPAFASFLTADAEFRFGNAAPVTGRDAIEPVVAGFFAAIGGCRHRLITSWERPASVACEGEVTYTRHDGRHVTVPFANVFWLRLGGIARYHIYIDNTPLFTP